MLRRRPNQSASTVTNELVKVIDNVGAITVENTAAINQISASTDQVNRSAETVAGIAEENSASTEQVSASAQEISAQVQQIVSSSQAMKEMSLSLEQSISIFRMNNEVEIDISKGKKK